MLLDAALELRNEHCLFLRPARAFAATATTAAQDVLGQRDQARPDGITLLHPAYIGGLAAARACRGHCGKDQILQASCARRGGHGLLLLLLLRAKRVCRR